MFAKKQKWAAILPLVKKNIITVVPGVGGLLFIVQCFVLYLSAAMNGLVAIWQGTPLTIDSIYDILVSGTPLLNGLNVTLIPAFVLVLAPFAFALSVLDSIVRAGPVFTEEGA